MNLTNMSVLVKRAAKILLAFAIIYYVYILILQPSFVSFIKNAFFRTTPPNPIFGQVGPLEFIEKPISGDTAAYVLNTKNGRLPGNIPEKAVVYRFKPAPFSYLAGKNALDDATTLGFPQSDLTSDLKGKTYQWRDIITGATLEIQTESKELVLNTDLSGKHNDFPLGTIDQSSAKASAEKILRSIGRFDDGLYPKGYSIVHLGKIIGGALVETKDPKEAQIAMVDFYRGINSSPILGPDPKKGMLHMIVGYPQQQPSPLVNPVVETYLWEIDPNSSATYPIITVQEAWKAITDGKGVITNVTPKDSNPFSPYSPTRVESILIDNIYLAYYDNPILQQYLQPIYVFEGKYTTKGTEGGSISLYFPAITNDYVQLSSGSQP